MNSAESYQFDFKTAVFTNTLEFKDFFNKQTGPVQSKMFFGTSPLTLQAVSWYYIIDPAQEYQDGNTYTSIQVQVDSKCILSELHGELRVEFANPNLSGRVISGRIIAGSRIGEPYRILRSTITQHLTRNNALTLTLRLNLSIHEQLFGNDPLPAVIKPIDPQPDSQLLDHFAGLMESEKFADVTIIIAKREFLAHKAILTARSPYFAAMFEHDMKESKENKVTLEDIEPEVFLEVLRFIYTGLVKKLDQLASELLVAADKYALDKLKAICEDQLKSTLSVETASKTLCLADVHHAEQLKMQAVQFITRNIKAIPAADWQTIIASNPALAAQMFAEMARLS